MSLLTFNVFVIDLKRDFFVTLVDQGCYVGKFPPQLLTFLFVSDLPEIGIVN